MENYILNHYYKLRHDEKRTYIIASNFDGYEKPIKIDVGWTSKIHPVYAMILSYFSDPITLKQAINEIAYFLSEDEEYVKKLIHKLVASDEQHQAEYMGYNHYFPANLIIKEEDAFCESRSYSPEDFQYSKIDLASERLIKAPLTVVYMINNTCATNCSYCYADKTTKANSLSIIKINEILESAKNHKVKDFMITGGEFFLYKEWAELMKSLITYDYKPDLISTKVPLTESDIVKFKQFNTRIQISLDTLNPVTAVEMLDVNQNYISKIIDTIMLLDKHQIKFQIATVLTSQNEDFENVRNIYEFVKTLNNLGRWEVRVAFKSLYSNSNFEDIKIKKDKIAPIGKWIEDLKATTKMNILWVPSYDETYKTTDGGSRNFKGPRCSANVSNMIILPDGKVTICEQLYWNKHFIIGDVTQQSIENIWNSKEAKNLSDVNLLKINSKSPCGACKDFEDCFSFGNRCIADVMKAYGEDNSDYPDPRCKIAPKFVHDITHN